MAERAAARPEPRGPDWLVSASVAAGLLVALWLGTVLWSSSPFLASMILGSAAWLAWRTVRTRRPARPESEPDGASALRLLQQYRRTLTVARGASEREAVRRLLALAAVIESALRTAPEPLRELFAEARRRSLGLARRGLAALEIAQEQADRLELAERTRIGAGECDDAGISELRAAAARSLAALRARHEDAMLEVARVTAALERIAAETLSSAAPIATSARGETRRLLEESELAGRAARALRELPAEGEERPLPALLPPISSSRPVSRRICPGPILPIGIAFSLVAMLAAIAIPNVMVFGCRSKQSEAKTNLSGLFTAEKAFFGQYGYYTTDLTQLNWVPDGAPMYLYGFAADGPARDGNHPERRTTIHSDVVAFGGYRTDKMKDLSGAALHPGELARVADASAGPAGFRAVAVGDIDTDESSVRLDVWTIDQDKRLSPVESDCAD